MVAPSISKPALTLPGARHMHAAEIDPAISQEKVVAAGTARNPGRCWPLQGGQGPRRRGHRYSTSPRTRVSCETRALPAAGVRAEGSRRVCLARNNMVPARAPAVGYAPPAVVLPSSYASSTRRRLPGYEGKDCSVAHRGHCGLGAAPPYPANYVQEEEPRLISRRVRSRDAPPLPGTRRSGIRDPDLRNYRLDTRASPIPGPGLRPSRERGRSPANMSASSSPNWFHQCTKTGSAFPD